MLALVLAPLYIPTVAHDDSLSVRRCLLVCMQILPDGTGVCSISLGGVSCASPDECASSLASCEGAGPGMGGTCNGPPAVFGPTPSVPPPRGM
jgi:hypothetical protein